MGCRVVAPLDALLCQSGAKLKLIKMDHVVDPFWGWPNRCCNLVDCRGIDGHLQCAKVWHRQGKATNNKSQLSGATLHPLHMRDTEHDEFNLLLTTFFK